MVTACSIATSVAPWSRGAEKAHPSPGHAATAQLPPAEDKTLETLLDQYSKAYSECKSARRKLAGLRSSLPPRLAASQRELLAKKLKQESACQQSAKSDSAQAMDESKRDAELRKQQFLLAAKSQYWQDSIKTQAEKQLDASSKSLGHVTLTLRQALAAKRKGFKFQLHGITYQAYVVDLKEEKIQLHLNQDSVKHTKFTNLERLRDFYKQRGQSPAMLTNAGMFHANQEPVGLLIADGVVINPLNVQKPATDENFYMSPNGVFFVDTQNMGHIDSTGGYQRQWEASRRQHEVREATQSGPMLVINNRLNPHFSELSTNTKVRSGVGIINNAANAGSRVVFLTTDGESTFYDFATTFRDLFSCSNALFLDGAISKMYLAGEQTNYTGGFFGPMVSVISRTSEPKRSSVAAAGLGTTAKQAAALPGAIPAKAAPRDSATSNSSKKQEKAIAAPSPAAPSSPAPAPVLEQGQKRLNVRKGHE